jgi:hypothetical protein
MADIWTVNAGFNPEFRYANERTANHSRGVTSMVTCLYPYLYHLLVNTTTRVLATLP